MSFLMALQKLPEIHASTPEYSLNVSTLKQK